MKHYNINFDSIAMKSFLFTFCIAAIKLDRASGINQQMSEGNSVADFDPTSFIDDEETIIPIWLVAGRNPQVTNLCVEIKVDVSNEWEIENLKKSIEHSVFLRRYCGWLRKKGVKFIANEHITIKLLLGREEILVHSQKTPDTLIESDGKIVVMI